MLLRARTVLPIAGPPIDDGVVLVRGRRIETVGRWNDLRSSHNRQRIDLGDSIVLPGLINAHCHLDYSEMAGKLSAGKQFSDWIKAIVAMKAQWSYSEFASSWLKGAQMLLRSGTTTVVDIEAVPELLPDVRPCTLLRVISCVELLAVRKRDPFRRLIESAVEVLAELPAGEAGLSPHAPYTTSGELIRAAARAARARQWLFTMHVAESADEFEMFQHGAGAMFQWLKTQRDMSDCDGRSPIQHLERSDTLGEDCLAVHANYLAPGDAELLARTGTSVVHCPRSHAFFGHRAFPFEELTAAGVNICLGTDSLATVSKSRGEPLSLNMFSEMRAFAKTTPALSPRQVIELATLRAAKAIRREHQLGALRPNANADLIALPWRDKGDVYEAVLNHRGDVRASMIGGAWAIEPAS
jgi:cytosine/adenosine deaminase-related metal-dependent hydrolase